MGAEQQPPVGMVHSDGTPCAVKAARTVWRGEKTERQGNPCSKLLPITIFWRRRPPKVKEYVVSKYGADRVSEIITFDFLKARAAVKDTGRALGVPYALCDQITKHIDPRNTIAEAMAEKKMVQSCANSMKRIRLRISCWIWQCSWRVCRGMLPPTLLVC